MGVIIVTTRTYARVNGFIDTVESVGAQCLVTILLSFTYNYVIIIYFNVGTSTSIISLFILLVTTRQQI